MDLFAALGGTRYVLKHDSVSDALGKNEAGFADATALMQDGQPPLLLKPSLAVPHDLGETSA